MKYFEWIKALSNIYLEDSYVLEIRESGSRVEFDMEFVLLENHPNYAAPLIGEKYCYRRGLIRLDNCSDKFFQRSLNVNSDADGEIDLGNIDIFDRTGDLITLSGDWGELSLTSCDVIVFMQITVP
jgi:hypothetical protein